MQEWPLVKNPVFQAHCSNISHLTDGTVLVELSASSVVSPSQGCEAWINVSICFVKEGSKQLLVFAGTNKHVYNCAESYTYNEMIRVLDKFWKPVDRIVS